MWSSGEYLGVTQDLCVPALPLALPMVPSTRKKRWLGQIKALNWKQAKCPSAGGWINKWWYIFRSGFPGGAGGKASACQCRKTQETQLLSLSWEDPLEKEMTTHSSILAYKISWIKESGRLQSMDSQSRM